jgi:hypothetical protein
MPESRDQVISVGGDMKVHSNVVFMANTAVFQGGAVSPPLEAGGSLPSCGSVRYVCEGHFDLRR